MGNADQDFVDSVRTMLLRRSHDVPDNGAMLAPGPYAVRSSDQSQGPLRHPLRAWIGGAAAALTLLCGGAVFVLAQDAGENTVATEQPPEPSIVVGTTVSQPTDAVAVVPVTSSIYVGVADVDATVNMYLHDRLPEATSDNGLEVQPAIVSAASASARWTRIEVGGERNTLANGVIYLRNEGGTWHVTSSTVDAISVDDLRYRGGLLVGTATTTDDLNDSLAVDVLSLDGVPVEGSPNPTGYPGSTFLYGTAGTGTGKVEFGVSISSPVVVRVSLIGGNRLAVSEFVVDPASGPPSAG